MSGLAGLDAIGLRNLGERKGRSLLTAAGITLGVALFVGALIAAATTSRATGALADEAAGQADVLVTSHGGVAANLINPTDTGSTSTSDLARLATLSGVEAAEGVVGFPTVFEASSGERTALAVNQVLAQSSLVGVDLQAGDVFPVRTTEGRLPVAAADEVALPHELADDLGVSVGETLRASTPTGERTLTVVGVLAEEGVGRLGAVGFTSLETAQIVAGRAPDSLAFIALRLGSAQVVQDWIDTNEAAIGGGLSAVPASIAVDRLQEQLNMLAGIMTVMAAAVLFSGGYLIHLTLSMTVVERTRLYGTLHALGATRPQVRRVVVLEAVGMGAAASVVGVGLGVAVAVALNVVTARALSWVGSPSLYVAPWALAAGLAFGLVTSVLAALIPARRAARLDPIAAIRETDASPPPRPVGWLLGAAMLLAGLAGLGTSSQAVQTLALLAVLIGATRLVPPLVQPLAATVRGLVTRLSPGTGEVAVLHLAKEPSRSAATLALVMTLMATTFAVGALTVSFVRSLEDEVDRTFTNDLLLTAASSFPPDFVAAVSDHPDVRAASSWSRASTFHVDDSDGDGGSFVFLDVIDPATYFDMASYWWTEGDDASAQALLERGRAVIVPAPFAERLKIGRGDSIELRTSQGTVEFEVAALARISNVPVRLVVGVKDGRELFGVAQASMLALQVRDGVDPADAAAAIERDLGAQATFIVSTASDLRADARAQILGISNGFFVLLLLGGLVGLFGLANTLAVSIIQRVREIGVLRALGATRVQVGSMAIVEAVTLVAIAVALSVPLGWLISGPLLGATTSALGDFDAPLIVPWVMVPVIAGLGLVLGGTAAVWPARRAARTEIDSALRFE